MDDACGGEAIDEGVEGALACQCEIEECAGLVRFGLWADKSRRRPRGFEAEAAALEHADLDAVGCEPPCDRTADYAAANYESFHATRLPARWGRRKRGAGGRSRCVHATQLWAGLASKSGGHQVSVGILMASNL